MTALLETLMLLAFSAGWYFSVWKMLRKRRSCGKSLVFVGFVAAGYACGVGTKLLAPGPAEPVVWLYGWNLAVVLFDGALVVHYGRVARRGLLARAIAPFEHAARRLSGAPAVEEAAT